MTELKWISTEEELPPEDEMYMCTNDLYKAQSDEFGHHQSLLYYDGYGFKNCKDASLYLTVKYWKYRRPSKKAYGKLKK
jgi:hypothetical protein